MIETQIPKEVYYHRENLINSCDGRRVDALTITHNSRIDRNCEASPEGLYPDKGERARRFNKPVVVISARVHPGETPASYMCNGFINFLIGPDPRAEVLREEFLFKIIPFLNPDGVYRGHWRTDTFGVNLNRSYINPDREKAPTIFALCELVKVHQEKIYAYIDLHAHPNKRGMFMFGN